MPKDKSASSSKKKKGSSKKKLASKVAADALGVGGGSAEVAAFALRPRSALSPAMAAALPENLRRFSLHGERTLQQQIDSLSENEREAFEELKGLWGEYQEKLQAKKSSEAILEFSDEMFLKFIRCSPGDTKFNVKASLPVLKNYAPWCLKHGFATRRLAEVEENLRTMTLFLPPGLKAKGGYEFLYMMPSRFFPSKTSTEDIINSLVYLLDHMTDKEVAMRDGIAFMANMKDWGYSNFSVDYCKRFFETMQGRFPCRVRVFLIINPPSWFGAIWRIIKGIITKEFAEKVHMPNFEQMTEFLDDSCSVDNLPDEFGGKLDSKQCVEDFIDYRRRVEEAYDDNNSDEDASGSGSAELD